MCLSMVFMNKGGKKNVIMKDVARIEAHEDGFWLVDLFGEKKFVEGTVKTIDLMNDHFLELEEPLETS